MARPVAGIEPAPVFGMTGTPGRWLYAFGRVTVIRKSGRQGAAGDLRPGQGLFELDPDRAAERLFQFPVLLSVQIGRRSAW